MNGYAIIEERFRESNDLEQIKAAMPTLSAILHKLGADLSETLPHDQIEASLKKIDTYSAFWNRNVEVLNRAEQILSIRRLKESIKQLKWPPEEAGQAGSSS
ncbi:MAG TPA: hypothetical protein VF628_13245 [Allosphingosinicella sp.]